MPRDARILLRDLGLLLHVPGLMALATLPVCLLYDERFAIAPFLWTAALGLGIGEFFYRLFRAAGDTRLHHGMFIAALGWLITPLLGALPIFLIAHRLAAFSSVSDTVMAFTSPWNALFEGYSGFTGTGLTVALRASELPRCLQWWRSLMEWIGGVGVIVLMLSILRTTMGVHHLYYSEAREEKIRPTVASTVRTIWWLYLLLTLASIGLLRLVGMTWWEAVNHGMTGIATGGFSVSDAGIADYGAPVRLALLLIMVAGAVSFAVHYEAIHRRRLAAYWGDSQHRFFWILLGAGAVLLLAENLWASGSFLWLDSLFQWTAALTTTGFQSADLRSWSPTAKLLLCIAMLIGGAAGSTCGGLKQLRLALLHKGMMWRFRRTVRRPHEVMRYRFDNQNLAEAEADRLVEAAGVLAALWATVLWISILILLHFVPQGFTLSEVIFEVASAQSNVGLSTGITHPALHWAGKLTLILTMWVGRLEIMPVLILAIAAVSPARRLLARAPAPPEEKE